MATLLATYDQETLISQVTHCKGDTLEQHITAYGDAFEWFPPTQDDIDMCLALKGVFVPKGECVYKYTHYPSENVQYFDICEEIPKEISQIPFVFPEMSDLVTGESPVLNGSDSPIFSENDSKVTKSDQIQSQNQTVNQNGPDSFGGFTSFGGGFSSGGSTVENVTNITNVTVMSDELTDVVSVVPLPASSTLLLSIVLLFGLVRKLS